MLIKFRAVSKKGIPVSDFGSLLATRNRIKDLIGLGHKRGDFFIEGKEFPQED